MVARSRRRGPHVIEMTRWRGDRCRRDDLRRLTSVPRGAALSSFPCIKQLEQVVDVAVEIGQEPPPGQGPQAGDHVDPGDEEDGTWQSETNETSPCLRGA